MKYTIPNWDGKGNVQVYVEQPDGTFHDLYNEVERSAEFVQSIVELYDDTIVSDEQRQKYFDQMARDTRETLADFRNSGAPY